MRAFQAAFIGRHEFPKNLSDFELRQWFTFDERDRRSIRKAFRSRYWIGAALHLGFLAMTGTGDTHSHRYASWITLRWVRGTRYYRVHLDRRQPMQTVTQALELLKRQSELEAAMRQPGGVRVTEEQELHLVRRRLQELPEASQAVIGAAHALRLLVTDVTADEVEQWATTRAFR